MAKLETKWSNDFIWKAYALAAQGESSVTIAKSIGVAASALIRWKKKHKALANAIAAGKKKKAPKSNSDRSESMREYVHGRLPEDLKQVWTEIMGADTQGNILPMKRLNALLGNCKDDQKARQTLWLYIWFESNFNQSEACRQMNISHNLVRNVWKKDPDFFNLFNEMNKIKGDFYESAMVKGVRDGNPYLIAFANKTYNRDRGYGETLDINVSGTIQHNHVVSIEDLNLPIEVRKQLLVAVREQQKITEANQVHELTNDTDN